MKLRTIGIDRAKNVFQACGVNDNLKPQFNIKLKRAELLDFLRQKSTTTVVMEACYSAHYWGVEITKENNKTATLKKSTEFIRGPE